MSHTHSYIFSQQENAEATLLVHILPALKDNYIYILQRQGGKECVVIDPGEAAPVADFLCENGLRLSAILLTHHHWDHVNGVAALLRDNAVPVYGFAGDAARLPRPDKPLEDGAVVEILGLDMQVIHVPGHTLGAILLHFPQAQIAFMGDTLFTMGCGRMFEGTAPVMWQSMQKITALPQETMLYSGHEYAAANAQFARHVMPGNALVRRRLALFDANDKAGIPNQPSRLADELVTNPFLQADEADLMQVVRAENGAECFGKLRAMKDNF